MTQIKNFIKAFKICYLTTMLYMFFIGYKLIEGEFIIPQDYYIIGLLTLLVIISYIYDIIRYHMKNKHEYNMAKITQTNPKTGDKKELKK